jgi:hypothetical protein
MKNLTVSAIALSPLSGSILAAENIVINQQKPTAIQLTTPIEVELFELSEKVGYPLNNDDFQNIIPFISARDCSLTVHPAFQHRSV